MKFYLSLIQLVLLCHFFIAVALLFEFCLKLKSGPFKHIFPTIQKHYLCIYSILAMAGALDAIKPERFAGGQIFVDGRLWSNFG
jgi:hypothetical protein